MSISIELTLLILSILFFLSILAGKAGDRYGIPALLLFLGVGMLGGSDGAGIQFENIQAAQVIGTISLSIILFSGGLDTRIAEIRPVVMPGMVLATFGVFLTAGITGVLTWWIFRFFEAPEEVTLLSSLLMAAAMASTDSASVFSVLRSKGIQLKHNLRPLLELESGSNDPVAYLLTITLISIANAKIAPFYHEIAVSILIQLLVGAMAGYALGKLAVYVTNHIRINNNALYPVLVLTFSFFIFSSSHFLGGNSYLAVYIGGLVIGNAKLVHKRSSMHFFDGLAWMSQLLMFLTLGLLVNPHELIPVIVPGMIVSFIIIFISRPVSVFLSLLPFRKIPLRGKLFVSWVGLRGAVPIIFSIMALAADVPHARTIFNIVFFCTLVSLVVQGITLSPLAEWLGLTDKTPVAGKSEHFDISLSDEIKSVTAEITITPDMLQGEHRLMDLPLPNNTLVVLVKRAGSYFVPTGKTGLEVNDNLLIITDNARALHETEEKLGIVEAGKQSDPPDNGTTE